jgi:hypothetical protein
MNKLSIAALIATAAVTANVSAQSAAPVPEVKMPTTDTATEAIRTVNITPENQWINVGENERVKFVADGTEQIVNFGQPGTEKVDVGGKQIVVYVSGVSQFSSPGQ